MYTAVDNRGYAYIHTHSMILGPICQYDLNVSHYTLSVRHNAFQVSVRSVISVVAAAGELTFEPEYREIYWKN